MTILYSPDMDCRDGLPSLDNPIAINKYHRMYFLMTCAIKPSRGEQHNPVTVFKKVAFTRVLLIYKCYSSLGSLFICR